LQAGQEMAPIGEAAFQSYPHKVEQAITAV
jgi:hypothetical protein